MNQKDETVDVFVNKASEHIQKLKKVNLSTSEIQSRINNELKPVLTQLKAIIQEVADAIAHESQDNSQLIKKIQTMFIANFCQISFDQEAQYKS